MTDQGPEKRRYEPLGVSDSDASETSQTRKGQGS
jgi:hypothetical protein